MNVSGLNNENCYTLTGNETHFCGMFQRTPMKTAVIFISSLLTLIDVAILCGVIWYQQNGSDNKTTLMNRIFTSLCCTGLLTMFNGLTDIIRYTVGPFPPLLCTLQLAFKRISKDAILFYYNAITLSRSIFIFWLKNPTAVNDNFWITLINKLAMTSCTFVAIVYSLLPGPKLLAFYTCCDINPGKDVKLEPPKDGFILFLTLILQIFANGRIVFSRHSEKLRSFSNQPTN